jgi:hypothetical protein
MRYDVVAQCGKDRDGKYRSCRIGAAFPNQKNGNIDIILNALPLARMEGDMTVARITLMEHTDRNSVEPERVRPRAAKDDRDDREDGPDGAPF